MEHNLQFLVFLEKLMKVLEGLASHLSKQGSKLILPFITVTEKSKLEGGAIKQNKLNVEDCFFFLYIVSYFSVPAWKKIW